MKYKTNGKKCLLNNSQYPDCSCNECIENIIEYKTIKKNHVYLLEGRHVFVTSLCPLESCAEVFYNNNHSLASKECKNGNRFGWVSYADQLLKANKGGE